MEQFFQEVSTPYFWLAVVGVGIAVNLLSSLIAKLAPRLGIGVVFWWRVRTKLATENQSQREKEFRAKVSVVANQPALIGSFLIRAYALYLCGAAICLLGLWGFGLAIIVDGTLIYGPKHSLSWWWGMFDGYAKAILAFTFGIQALKLANQRYLIATIAEERVMESGRKKLTEAASPAPPSAL